MTCLLNVPGCLWGQVLGLIGLVPWWGWAVAASVLVGFTYKVSGWPGIVGLFTLWGYLLGRHGREQVKDAIAKEKVKKMTRPARERPLRKAVERVGQRFRKFFGGSDD